METQVKDVSQAGQSTWVLKVTGLAHGIFLDIGCGTREFYSNTWMLEQIGWTGWLIDNSPVAKVDAVTRMGTFILDDATAIDYGFLPARVDYLSLDVDNATLDVLKVLPLDRVRFQCITIETDMYRLGKKPRDEMREILIEHGYDLVVPDVKNDGLVFEDWYVSNAS